MLGKLKLHFLLLEKDPYKDCETIHIEVKQVGIPVVVQVKTASNKKFRKDKYGFYRLVSTTVRKRKSKGTKRQPAKKRVAHAAYA